MYKKIIYFIPIPLLFFAVVKYICSAMLDLPALNDYIRLICNLVGEGKFRQFIFSPAVVTSAPFAVFSSWINIECFGFSVYYDLILGAVGLALIAVVFYRYSLKHTISLPFYGAVLVCIFSLNKWEMILNGTGWVHFWTFAAFYFYYLYLDKWYVDQEKNRVNQCVLVILPVLTILGIAVFYAAVFAFVTSLFFCIIIVGKKQKKERIRHEVLFLLSVDLPFLLYAICSILQKDTRIVSDGSFFASIVKDPQFFIRMFTASFSSEVVGVETLLKYENGMNAAYILGIFVMLLYGIALYWNLHGKIYQKTCMPLLLLVSGICNHILVLISRWGFHNVTYGMSPRYSLQYLEGLLGILLTAALLMKHESANFRAGGGKCILCLSIMVLLGGSLVTTYDELKKVPYRMGASEHAKEVFLNYESYSDEELKQMFVTKDGGTCREAFGLLKKYRLSIWKSLGNDLETSYKIYGVYEDQWLEKNAKIVTFVGRNDKVTLGFYLPEGSLGHILGEPYIEAIVNGRKYVLRPQEETFDFTFEGIEEEVADIEIHAGFTMDADGDDQRERSVVLYKLDCK